MVVVVAAAIVTVATVRDHLSSDPVPIDELREQYSTGVIDESESEKQVAFYVDDRNERIRIVVEDVPGIAEATSKAIAREYESLEDLGQTNWERLESVPGVGEQRDKAVVDRICGPC